MKGILQFLEESVAMISLVSGGIALVAMVSLTFVEASVRYLSPYALGVSDEFSGYFLVAIIFWGLAYVTKKDAHISIDIVTSRLSTRANHWLRVFTLLLFLAFSVLMTKLGYDYTLANFTRGARSGYIWRTPLWVVVIPIAAGFFLTSLSLIVKVAHAVQKSGAESQ